MNVNNDVFENKWEQIRAQSKGWWSLFSESDLNKVEKAPIKRAKYIMLLRVKYGYTHERAREEINRRVADLEANPPSKEVMRESLDRQNDSRVAGVRKRRRKHLNRCPMTTSASSKGSDKKHNEIVTVCPAGLVAPVCLGLRVGTWQQRRLR